MGYRYVLPGNEPQRFVLGNADLTAKDCKGRQVQIGVPAILPNGKYTKEYIWVIVTLVEIYKSDNGGKKIEFCGEALNEMMHEAPLSKNGWFAWQTRTKCLPMHNEKYTATKVARRTVLRFKKEDIVDVEGVVAA